MGLRWGGGLHPKGEEEHRGEDHQEYSQAQWKESGAGGPKSADGKLQGEHGGGSPEHEKRNPPCRLIPLQGSTPVNQRRLPSWLLCDCRVMRLSPGVLRPRFALSSVVPCPSRAARSAATAVSDLRTSASRRWGSRLL